MIIQTNKISSFEHYHSVLGADGASTITSKSDREVIAIELVNFGAADAFFSTDAVGAATATAADRVLLVGERLILPVSCNEVRLFSTTGTSVEVNFLR
jgi:hypothetical protein